VILAAAVCPHPPLLFRELTGQQLVADDLRAACLSVIGAAISTAPDRVVLVGGATTARMWDPSTAIDVRRFGTTGPRVPDGLPLSLGVGTRLLAEAGWHGPVERVSVRFDSQAADVQATADDLVAGEERVALVVLGDGSTRRGEKAPGFLDERASAFDEATGRALREGDAEALVDMHAGLAHELMVLGRAAFQVLGAVALAQRSTPRPTMAFQDDPFGVTYFVCLWELAPQ
jgi:hypothetical protein